MSIDVLSKSWIRNPADEKAVAAGMRFDMHRAAYAVWFMGRYLRLYEGSHAGEPLILRGAHSQPLFASQEPWKEAGAIGKKETVQYIRDYMEARAGGESCDWPLEVTCRLYGWVCYDNFWKEWIRRFQRFIVFTAKKNKKSPMLAANAIYSLAAEGEAGQKVYLCASTGDQAKQIAGKHALEMIRQSPALCKVCRIDESKGIVYYTPTQSILQPLYSGNVRAQMANEGRNGSGFVDECHVVDSAYVEKIKRMGISRKEPLFGGFSTAGSGQDSWGYEQWDFGTKNNKSGTDLRHLFCSYEAKQTASDAEIANNLDDCIRAANPALGHTVRLEEVRDDYAGSLQTEQQKREFYRYRLNIWGGTDNQWLPSDLWANSLVKRFRKAKATEPAWGAIYLGYVDEPAALTLVWPNDTVKIDRARSAERVGKLAGQVGSDRPGPILLRALDQKIRCRTWYWLPRGAVENFGHAFPYAAWEEARCCTVLPGIGLDMDRIARDIIRILATCDVQALAYDPGTAGVLLGAVCEAGHYPLQRCFEFPRQAHQRWAFSVALVERLLRGGKLKHRENAALDWEIGHAEVKPDRLGGAYLVEPERGDRKTVAGPASVLMALDAMAKAERFYKSELMFL